MGYNPKMNMYCFWLLYGSPDNPDNPDSPDSPANGDNSGVCVVYIGCVTRQSE